MEFPLNKGGQGVVKENFTILFSFSVMLKYKPLLFCIVVMHTYLISYNILKDFSRTLMIINIKNNIVLIFQKKSAYLAM